MREDQCGAPFHETVEGILDDRFVLRVDRGKRFVQHEDRRVSQDCPGDSDALPLSA